MNFTLVELLTLKVVVKNIMETNNSAALKNDLNGILKKIEAQLESKMK